jgi:hypothetical protein
LRDDIARAIARLGDGAAARALRSRKGWSGKERNAGFMPFLTLMQR